MKRNLIDLTIFCSLVFLTVALALLSDSDTTELQFHDTYFVVDRLSLAVLALGPLLVVLFLPLAVTRKFQSIGTNIALIIGLVIIAVICYRAIDLQSSYLQQAEALRDEQLPDRARYLNNIKGLLNWSRAIFAGIVLPATVLIYRTVKIWKETNARPQL